MIKSNYYKCFVLAVLVIVVVPVFSYAASWSSNTQLNQIPEGLDGISTISSYQFSLSDSGEYGMAVWLQKDYSEVTRVYTSYYNGTWSDIEIISLENGYTAQTPYVAVNNDGQGLVSWRQYDGEDTRVFTQFYDPSSGGWNDVLAIDEDVYGSYDNTVSLNNNGIGAVTWGESNGTKLLVKIKMYTAASDSWGATLEVDNPIETTTTADPVHDINDNNVVLVAWLQSDGSYNRTHISACRYATYTCSVPAMVDNGTADNYVPKAVLGASNNAAVVWRENDSGYKLYGNLYKMGVGWLGSTRLDEDSTSVYEFDVAIDDSVGLVNVVWLESDTVYVREGSMATQSWAAVATNVHETSFASLPKISMNDGNSLVVFTDDRDIYFNYKQTSSSWAATSTEIYDEDTSTELQMVLDDNGDARVVFNNSRNFSTDYNQLLSLWYDLSEASWSEAIQVAEGASHEASDVSLAANSYNNSVAVWIQFSPIGEQELFANFYDSLTQTWSGQSDALDTGLSNIEPPIVKNNDDNQVVVAWIQEDESMINRAMANRYDPLTQSWSGPETIDADAQGVNYIDVALNQQGQMIVAWVEDSYKVMASIFNNGSWSAPVALADAPIDPWSVSVAMNNEMAHVVWLDDDGTSDYSAYVNTYHVQEATWDGQSTALDAGDYYVERALVSINDSNDSIVAWTTSTAASNYDLYANFYNAESGMWYDKTAMLGEDLYDYDGYRVSMSANGDVMLSWSSEDDSSSNVRAYANIYDHSTGLWSGVSSALDDDSQSVSGVRMATDAAGNGVVIWRHNDGLFSNLYSSDSWLGISDRLDAGDNTVNENEVVMDDYGFYTMAYTQYSDGTILKLYGKSYGSLCGDGVAEGQEACDDGNVTDGDGCSSVCELEEAQEEEDDDQVVVSDDDEDDTDADTTADTTPTESSTDTSSSDDTSGNEATSGSASGGGCSLSQAPVSGSVPVMWYGFMLLIAALGMVRRFSRVNE